MKITVSDKAIEYFWEEPPEHLEEFWSFQAPPNITINETIQFYYQSKLVAKATVSRVEGPGVSTCAKTCRFKNQWKVFWKHSTFTDLREKQ